MENLPILKEKKIKIIDIILFVLLFLWMIMPILQTIKILYEKINLIDIYFGLMQVIGVVGIGISLYEIYNKIRYSESKKQTIKQLLPIFLFVAFMAWTLIICIKSPYKRTVYKGTLYRKEGYYMYLNYAGFFLCSFLLKSEKLRKILLNIFLISAIYLIAISRLVLKNKGLEEIFVNTRVWRTVFAQFNHYGYFLMMCLTCNVGLFIKEKNKILKIIYLITYAIIGYAMIYNDTFGCYLATSVVLILYGIYSLIKKRDRKNILILITIFVLLSCITTNKRGINLAYRNITELASDMKVIITKVTGIKFENSKKNNEEVLTKTETNQSSDEEDEEQKELEQVGTSRMLLWECGIKFISKNPIWGYGPDNLGREYILEGITRQDRPHNLIIYLAGVSGIPGMLIYITAVGIIVIKGLKKLILENKEGTIYFLIVIAYLISSMFGNSMYYTSPYFFIFLGSLMKWNLEK